ncbi:hypothetical protein EI94DRAFT_1729099, partial [Lactarius quietus]
VHSAVNLGMGNNTGVHTAADVFCVGCGDRLGWNYRSQKYKEGKYLLERERLVKDNAWTDAGGVMRRSSHEYTFLRTIVCCTMS